MTREAVETALQPDGYGVDSFAVATPVPGGP